jgi:negative regulator of flagellin synthesis FlgM
LPITHLQGNAFERGAAMRIDLNPSTTPQLDRSHGSAASTQPAPEMTGPAGSGAVDVANFSTGSDAVQQLRAKLDSVPDVRQQRVNDLRRAIGNGTFQVSADQIADAMLADTSRTAS